MVASTLLLRPATHDCRSLPLTTHLALDFTGKLELQLRININVSYHANDRSVSRPGVPERTASVRPREGRHLGHFELLNAREHGVDGRDSRAGFTTAATTRKESETRTFWGSAI